MRHKREKNKIFCRKKSKKVKNVDRCGKRGFRMGGICGRMWTENAGPGPERGCCCDKDRKPVPAAGGWGGGAAEAGGPGAGGAPRGAGRAGDCPPVD